MFRRLFILLFLLLVSNETYSQVKAFDKLEMLYDQGHYAIVLRKSNQLLDNPEYDYSQIPSLYKSMALFQLSQNEYWFKRHSNSLEEAKELFIKIKSASDGKKVFDAHIFEISALKRDLISWSNDLKRLGQRQAFENIQEIMNGLFENVPDIEFEKQIKVEDVISEVSDKTGSASSRKEREKIIEAAKKYVGVPYVWAGNDPKGFDCSGFTSYVMKELSKDLPRRAIDQYESSVKVNKKNVEKGDLVFFDNGGGISHVGIIVSDKGQPLQMIHASSSQGIIVTDIENSAYWEKRVFGFGTYVSE